jgi:hypothetical protein
VTEGGFSNVVQLNSRAQASEGPSSMSGSGLLSSCREQLLSGLTTAFEDGLGDSQDHLFEMADRASSLDMQNLYFAAHNMLRKKGHDLVTAFRTQFTRGVDAAIAGGRREAFAPGGAQELQLVDEDVFERDLAISKLSARAAYHCAHPLTTLGRRVAELLKVRHLEQEDNPLGPKVIFNAFLRAGLELELGDQIAVALLQEFDRHIGDKLPNLYQGLNRLLVQHNVLPDLDHGSGEPSFREAAERASKSARPEGEKRPAHQPDPGAATVLLPPTPEELFLRLAQGATTYQSTVQPTFAPQPLSPPRPMAAQLLAALTNLQRGTGAGVRSGTQGGQLRSGVEGVLRQIGSTPLAQLAGPADGVTIDIVATLFDLIFRDHALSDALRAQVARLQIPALKVALMDKTFFSNKHHPLRRLVDAIASSATGWSDEEMPRLVAEIQDVVDGVEDHFDDDIGVFVEQLGRLETFLQQEDAQAHQKSAQLVEGLERRDRIERSRSFVADQIDRRIKQRDVPPLVGDFLSKLWRLYLIRVFVDKGRESSAWSAALQTMDDLVWSVQPKHESEERQRLLAMLPDLLKRLRSGLDGLIIAKADRDEFFRQLVRLHMAAMRADLPQTVPEAPPSNGGLVLSSTPAEAPAPAPEPAGQAAAMDSPDPPAVQPPAKEPEDKYLLAARELDLGAWVEFTSDRGTHRTLRLTWVSGFKTIYLFAGRQGDDPLSLPISRLAQRLREGSARILSGDRLTERAVNQLLEASKKEAADCDA